MKELIQLHPTDNVIIALRDFKAGERISFGNETLTLTEDIPRRHKIALRDIAEGRQVIKYGFPIGHATTAIVKGGWVHTHNVKTNLKDTQTYEYRPKFAEHLFTDAPREVNIYRRKNGGAGIRNELWIIPTVGCVNAIGQRIMEAFLREAGPLSIDGVNVLTHNYGCSQLGEDHANTRTILQDTVKHPNAGGVLVLGLGCENNQMAEFVKTLGDYDPKRVKFLVAQEAGDEIAAGKNLLLELYAEMKNDKREKASIAEISFGLECGGSDGFSGITANPMLGLFSDYVISQGGTTVLTEVPEMFGAETLLMERCKDRATFEKCVLLINNFKEFFLKNGQEIYENPSPGNKRGGITSLEDKSLGCTQKSGGSPVADVLRYGETLKTKGLNLLSAPGNDLVATTALLAAGCQLVLFTTGLGNPYGGYGPTVKISTNTQLYEKKPAWIDFDAGRLVTEDLTMEDLTREFIDYIVGVVNGERVCNEKNNFREIAIFKSGVTL
ncbi:MAG: altronate dehydratase family protein [Fusobacteriaceae bacterium]|jgi:altronate hydrolase|nr:altronate dehydratase family protein [Fusobacteriaceae bacterium]